ncbi:uncharacterized protein GIQ15_01478 [Arthroderma uncinatum]|uniref:uncharacterized protein n=1 Tax=Arthroderma uncinatum TaxID=74035 RepID=UPI00144A6AC1|nr:uncharacterized protein GIQ15_01478 [Arthroderma uncinatum]KAF3491961.1 hypothetical protein GIQ15_01478 [Arthroderma uncinatum]
MASKSSILHPPNETEHSSSRITREGKKITYSLRVMQQPERARACGAGAKSSADRRPVDPPPIVEMRIFESDPNNDMQKTDVTFSYNANFFLFATLEWARPFAHGRVQGQPPSCPVLTGVPVAGIAYLDRPSQAGYFIFPDLSVRHEGLYRLNFSLYEEPKDAKDEDKVALAPVGTVSTTGMTMPMKSKQPQKSMYFRLEVKTVAFTVFSAKKFPGLSESTTLSRIVAEQGCRVRIRRDVRMRRREPKSSKDYGGYDERHVTPDSYHPGTPVERPRSTSNSGMEGGYYCPTPQRAQSVAQGYGYPPPPPPPGPPSQQYQQPAPGQMALPGPPVQSQGQSHLSFGAPQPQYCAPQLPPQHQQQQQQQSQQQQPPHHPPTQGPYSSPMPSYTHLRHSSTSTEYESQNKYPPYQQQQQPPHTPSRQLSDPNPKASLPPISIPHESSSSAPRYDYRSSDPKAYHSTTSQTPQMPPPSSLIAAAPSLPPYNPSTANDVIEPATPTEQTHSSNSSSSSNSQPPPTYDPTHGKGWSFRSEPVLSSKRGHTDVFGSAHLSQPLHHGKRADSIVPPSTSSSSGANSRASLLSRIAGLHDLDDDDGSIAGNMTYKRADGRVATRMAGPARVA